MPISYTNTSCRSARPPWVRREESSERQRREVKDSRVVVMKLGIRNTGNLEKEIGLRFLKTSVCAVALLLHHENVLQIMGRDRGRSLQGTDRQRASDHGSEGLGLQ